MRSLDEAAVRQFGIPSLLLMENAGRAVADEAMTLLPKRERAKGLIVLLCGKGNNGGDGFVAARHLHNRGLKVVVFSFQNPRAMKPDPFLNWNILRKMGIRVIDGSETPPGRRLRKALQECRLVVDALFGTGLASDLENPWNEIIRLANASRKPVLSVDIPSGLHADTGRVLGVCIRARKTVTLGLPKICFQNRGARKFAGTLVVADISLPRRLLQRA